MTVEAWLRSRTPAPPAALAARLRAVLGESLGAPAEQVPELFLAAGERVVADLLRSDSTARDSALDLLTADSLLTYAFEAAAIDVSSIERRSAEAMTRIGMLGDAGAAVA